MTFNLSNIKTCRSRNGYAMSCTLIINNTKVCHMRDAGDGGSPSFDIINKDLFQAWEKELNKQPSVFIPEYGFEIKVDKGLFIDLLHSALVNKQEFKLLAA